MLRLYSSNQWLALAMVPLFIAGILLPAFLHGPLVLKNSGFGIEEFAATHITGTWLMFTVVYVLIVCGALLSNFVFNRHEFHNNNCHMPALLYGCIASGLFLVTKEFAVLPAELLVLLGLNHLLVVYKQQRVMAQFFEAGFFFGLAAICFPPFIALGLVLWITLLYARAFNWREYAAAIIGFALPFLYWVAWKFFTGELGELVLFKKVIGTKLPPWWSFEDWSSKIYVIGIALIMLIALPRFVIAFERASNKSKHVKWIFLFLASAIILAGVLGGIAGNAYYISVLALPVTFVCSYWFANYRYSLPGPFAFYGWIALSVYVVVLLSR